jgi:hypothetical protein
MGKIQTAKKDALTKAIAGRIRDQWDAYIRVDESAHSAILAQDFRAVDPYGTVHIGRPSAKQIAAAPIEDYWLTDLQALALGEKAALNTYTAEVQVRTGESSQRFKFEVGEVWLRQKGQWKCRYYQATMQKHDGI